VQREVVGFVMAMAMEWAWELGMELGQALEMEMEMVSAGTLTFLHNNTHDPQHTCHIQHSHPHIYILPHILG